MEQYQSYVETSLLEEVKRHLNRKEFADIYKRALDGKDLDAQDACRADIQTFLSRKPKIAVSEKIVEEAYNDIIGYGPITPYLFADESEGISEIQINGPRKIYINQHGQWKRVNLAYRSDEEFENVINRMKSSSDVSLNDKDGYSDRIHLPNGSRGAIVKSPNTKESYFISIRTYDNELFSSKELVANGSVSTLQDRLILMLLRGRANSLWAGGTSTGKTTNLGAYYCQLPSDWNIVTVEDTPELNLEDRNPALKVIPLFTSEGGDSSFSWEKAYSFILRIAPDVICYSEVRHPSSTYRAINAMNTGHPGSAATIHAGTPRDAIENTVSFYKEFDPSLNSQDVREKVCRAVDFIPMLCRSRTGRRYMGDIYAIGWDDVKNVPLIMPMITRYLDRDDKPVEEFHGIPQFVKDKILAWHYVFEEDFEEWNK